MAKKRRKHYKKSEETAVDREKLEEIRKKLKDVYGGLREAVEDIREFRKGPRVY